MINTHWLGLPLSQTNFHSPKGIRAYEVLLYVLANSEVSNKSVNPYSLGKAFIFGL